MNDINPHGAFSDQGRRFSLDCKQQPKKKVHSWNQKQIHTVVFLQIQTVCEQPFQDHANKREGKSQLQKAFWAGKIRISGKYTQEQKNGSKKDAVSRVTAERKDSFIEKMQKRNILDQSIIAVAENTDDICGHSK